MSWVRCGICGYIRETVNNTKKLIMPDDAELCEACAKWLGCD